MPLRDHFHSPLDDQTSWESFHAGWPMVMAQYLNKLLPSRYVAGLHVHLGSEIELDVASFEQEPTFPGSAGENGEVYTPAQPNVAVETDLLSIDEYEVRVFDTKRNRRLVAAVEIVSPSNKDRAEARQTFVAKTEAMLRKGVSVAIVDLVTSRHKNLYAQLLELINYRDPGMGDEPAAIYAAACRWMHGKRKPILECWSRVLELGQPLPVLPLWLAENFAVPLELEKTYEETCRSLRIN